MMNTSEPRTLVTHPELRSHHSLPYFKTLGEAPKSRLEKLLSVFADVRAGEGVGTLLLALNVFLLLAGYSVMRPARDGLILAEGSAEIASYSAAAQAVLLMAVVPLYGWLGTRVPRIRLIAIVMSFFSATLFAFYLGGQLGLREGVAFYIWLGLINVFIVSQFWAFANDLYTEGQGRRLFPLIGVGQSLGALMGAAAVTPLIRALDYTPYTLMLLGACILMAALSITLIVNRLETARAEPLAAAAESAPLGPEGGFELVFKDRYLLWIAVLIVLLNIVNTTGNYLLNKFVLEEAAGRFSTDAAGVLAKSQFLTAFFGSVTATVNLVSFLLQLFVTSRVIRYFGVRGSLFILPASPSSITRLSRWRLSWPSCGSERFSRTASITPFRTHCGRRSFCRPHARRSTKPRRRSTRSSRGEAMCSPRASSSCFRRWAWPRRYSPSSTSR